MSRNDWKDVPVTPEPPPTLESLKDATDDLAMTRSRDRSSSAVWHITLLLGVLLACGLAVFRPSPDSGKLKKIQLAQQAAIDSLTAQQTRLFALHPKAPVATDSLSIARYIEEVTSLRMLQEQTAVDLGKLQAEFNKKYLHQ